MSSPVRYEVQQRVAVITIDNPPVNALAPAVWEGIDQAVARAGRDSDVDALALIGEGTTFVAGADIKIFDTLKTREQSLDRSAGTHALLRRLEDCAKPVVAAIAGHALGGGLELAMACHYRIASASAMLGQPEVTLGIIPGAGGTQRLPRLCGAKPALDMCTGGKPISAARALQEGIVDRVASRDLLEEAIAFAREQAGRGEARKTRDRGDAIADREAGLAACASARAGLASTARGLRDVTRVARAQASVFCRT
jgi:3-hydroxyacyl-CoA dehydrogenase